MLHVWQLLSASLTCYILQTWSPEVGDPTRGSADIWPDYFRKMLGGKCAQMAKQCLCEGHVLIEMG